MGRHNLMNGERKLPISRILTTVAAMLQCPVAAAAQEAPAQPDVIRPLTPIPPERLEQMVPKHPDYLGALAPENLSKPRPAAPFDVTGTWFVDLSKGFADYMFGPPYPRFGPEGIEALIEQPKAQARGETY